MAFCALFLFVAFGRGASVLALGGGRSLNQYVHTAWGADKGFVGGNVATIAQSSDGYLWLGTDSGLIRFDGFEFTLIDVEPLPGHFRIGAVRGLVEDGDGYLWIRLNGQRILRYRDGVFENATEKYELFGGSITAMANGIDNHLLLWGSRLRTIRFSHGAFLKTAPRDPINGIVTSIVENNTGGLWLATRDTGLYRFESGRYTQVLSQVDLLSVNVLAPSEEDGVWIGSEKGLYLWENGKRISLELPEELNKAQISALIRDHNHDLWVGTDVGLYRIDPRLRKVTGEFHNPADPRVSAIYEDREGDIWFANSRGVDRLRDGMFTSISGKKMPKEVGGSIFVEDGGSTWFAPVSGGLFHFVNGAAEPFDVPGLNHDVIYSITGKKDELWLGRREGGLTLLKRRDGDWSVQTFTKEDGLAQDSVYTVTRAHDGSIWAGTVSGGISVLRNRHFVNYNVDNGLRSNAIFASLESADHKMWFASPSGLVCFDGNRWMTYGSTDSGVVPNVRTIFEDSGHILWVGTSHGLARFEHGRIEMPHDLPQALNEEVLNIGEDLHGYLWVVTADRVLQVDRSKLLSRTLSGSDVLSYSLDDGLTETRGGRRDRSLVSDRSGRIWLSLASSLAVADVPSAENYRNPVRVRVDGITREGGNSIRPGNSDLPSETSSITFQYSGMNLSMPERTRFRYMLSGVDQTWSNDATLRQVAYSHLSPGRYTFRIMASNALGAWNGPEADVTFRILPAFWQTWYFQAIGCLLVVALGVLLYRVRMMQVTGHLKQRFQDRLFERTRIAQDLHDTLLQGVISASMQLDVAQDHLPEDSPTRPSLQRVLELMRQVTDEGREALRGLRTSDTSVTLETAFKRMMDDLLPFETSRSAVYVQGNASPLKQAVFDEVYRIGREAYTNAIMHAAASRIEITVEYGYRYLRLRVRDDGCGIDPAILKYGRDGHWGLSGMRERAESIGSPLTIRSRTPGGTDVELRVPAIIAYASFSPRRKLWRRRRYPKFPRGTS